MLPLIQLLIAIIFYIFSILPVFWEPLMNKFGSIQWDAVSVHFYNLFFSSETWRAGIFPLWTPYIFSGFPQIADLQVAFFYPANLLISSFAVFTPELAMRQIILHYFLAGVFAYLLAKYLSNNFWFSLAAGLVYSLGGFMAGHASHIGMQNAASWLPLIFLSLLIALKEEKNFFAALGGLFLGIAILAGHFQISLYIAYLIAFYFIFDFAWNAAGCLKTSAKKFAGSSMRKFRLILIFYIIAVLVSAIQILPTFELVRESSRAKITLEMSQTESLNPNSLQSLIDPDYNHVSSGNSYAGPWDRTQNYLYLGFGMLIPAILGIFSGIFYRSARKMTLFWLSLLIISLFYSFGEFGFLQEYFYRFLPFFDKIRAPANMMLLFDLSVIGLASSFFISIGGLSEKIADRQKINDPPHPAFRFFYNPKKLFLKNIPAFLGISVFLAASTEILPAAMQPNTLLYSSQKTSEVVAAPPISLRIKEEYSRLETIDKFRIFKIQGMDNNLTQLLHIFAFDGYNPLSLNRHSNYIDAMVKNEKLIDLAGIKYLPCEFIRGRADELEKIGAICVNKNYFQLAFLADDYIIAKNETDALRKTGEADLKKIAVLEENPGIKTDGKNYPNGVSAEKNNELSIIEFRPGFWKIAAKTDNDAFMVLSQANYPGWTAKTDGIPAKIYQADYLFQAVFVPGGKHEIIMEYKSKPLIIGAILTIIGLSSVFLIALYDFYKRRKTFKTD